MNKKIKKITGITSLRDDLIQIYQDARAGKTDYTELNAITNVAGKVINTARVQLKYHAHLKRQQIIPFLEN